MKITHGGEVTVNKIIRDYLVPALIIETIVVIGVFVLTVEVISTIPAVLLCLFVAGIIAFYQRREIWFWWTFVIIISMSCFFGAAILKINAGIEKTIQQEREVQERIALTFEDFK